MHRHLLTLFSCLFFLGCASIPKDYVPDDKVVFLKQVVDFGPIEYPAVAADPYVFKPDTDTINLEAPSFLKANSFEALVNSNFRTDSRIYREVQAHFSYVMQLPVLLSLRSRLDSADIKPPPPLAPNKGDKTKDYSNGAEFTYPEVPGATITILNSGDWSIDFPDKGTYKYFSDGSYQKTDGTGKTLLLVNKKQSYVEFIDGNTKWSSAPKFRKIETVEGNLEFNGDAEPQYHFTPAGSADGFQYVLFLKDDKSFNSCAVILKGGVRFDYLLDSKGVLITKDDQALSIEPNFQKYHQHFDFKSRKPVGLISYYLPEGVRVTNLEGPGPAYSVLTPAWPEQYKSRTIGPFEFFYTSKDEGLVAKLRAEKLSEIEANCRKLTGLNAVQRRAIVIPPDLDSYRKLFVRTPGEVLNWYPSGFESKDFITMWPLSVPRYRLPAGQNYFFEKEFYEIISHEYTHILVGENTGINNPVPYWLNEGLAVYVESTLSPETKHYWDVTFGVVRDQGRLLSWDDATIHPTAFFKVDLARIDYAQSYALVSALVKKFGPERVGKYIRSFWITKPLDNQEDDLKTLYKTNFSKTFGIPWEKTLELLKPEPPKN